MSETKDTWPIRLKPGQTAKLTYGPNFKMDELLMLELDEDILQEALDIGVDIKGDTKGAAVLCTKTSTYQLKHVATSNTVLLVPPAEADQDEAEASGTATQADENAVFDDLNSQNQMPGLLTQHARLEKADHGRRVVAIGRVGAQLEVVRVAPDLPALEALLQQHPYTQEEAMGLDEDAAVKLRGYSFEELFSRVQASIGELRTALETLGSVEVDGRWRLMEPKYLCTMLDMLLCAAVENDWSLEAVPAEEAAAFMKADGGFHPAAVRGCLRMHAAPHATLPGAWALDEAKVCLRRAVALLSQQARWKVDEFLPLWKQDVPSSMTPALEMLRGEALVEQVGPERVLVPFPASALPRAPAARFAALFRQRPRWVMDDLAPYLDGVAEPGQTADELLLKFTRRTQPTADATPVFSAR